MFILYFKSVRSLGRLEKVILALFAFLVPLQEPCPLLLLKKPEFVFTEEVINDTVETGGHTVREELLTDEGGPSLTNFTLGKLINILHHLCLGSGQKN